MTPFILEIKCSFNPLLDALEKNNAYLNELFRHDEIGIYLEPITGGFLLIMQSLETFVHLRNSELTQAKLDIIHNPANTIKSQLEDLVTPETYPKEGMTFFIRSPLNSPRVVYSIFKENFHQVDPCIKVTMDKAGAIKVHFPGYRSLDTYSKICYLFTCELEQAILCAV